MTKTAARILRLFNTLPERDQRVLVDRLVDAARASSFYDRMSPEQRAELDEAIAEVERGDTIPADTTFDDLALRFGIHDA